ncbi:1-aminocyclopropane-1-carboxylate deaminase/D-cysteine desulfhydrase [Rhabdothermincola sp.]|uniref:1-aminocyclopropane-1-carboxylate deaminase/D-cysteine desulfhydrase n=1 Tax=Rhabdothermincola sp. TaxID=2820405 RepID=UPI002FE0A96F
MSPPQRFPIAVTPTPLQPMDRLGRSLGFEEGALWVKRDDLTGLAGGGNKARKLDYLIGDALARGCDTLLTGGAAQSNHVRMTGAAARRAGLSCVAVLGGRRPAVPEGNLLLDELFGVQLEWIGTYDAERLETTMAEVCVRLAGEGRRPYEVPLGGASDVGTLGYVAAAAELVTQVPMGAIVYTATGSGGTQAGLAVGLGHHDRVRGVDVGAIPDVDERIEALVTATASLAGRPFPGGRAQLDRTQVGAGYGAPTPAADEAIRLAAQLEGLVLDPVYTGKALAALIADRRAGRLAPNQPTVFLHTGGLPSVFTSRVAQRLTSLAPG